MNFQYIKGLFKPYMGLPREIYVIFISRIINAMGAFIFPMLALIMTQKIGMSTGEAGSWIFINGLLFGPGSILGGKLADTIGRKKIIVIFSTLGALADFAAGFIEPSIHMIYLVILGSVFFGMAQPAHDALIADLTTPENRNGAYSLSYLGFNMGFAIGPIIGGFLFENHLKWIFLGDAITTLLATILVMLYIGETIHKTDEIGEDRKLEKKVEGSIFQILFKRPILIYFALVMFGYNFVYAQWGFMLPLHAGAALYGFVASFNGIVVMIVTPFITSFFTNTKNIRRIFYGGILYTIGFGMLGFISTKFAFMLSAFIFTTGEVLITISAMPFLANHTPASHRGRMSSTLPLLMGFGFTLGPLLMGKVLDFTSIPTGWKIIGVIMLTFTILTVALEKLDIRYEQKELEKEEAEVSKESVVIS